MPKSPTKQTVIITNNRIDLILLTWIEAHQSVDHNVSPHHAPTGSSHPKQSTESVLEELSRFGKRSIRRRFLGLRTLLEKTDSESFRITVLLEGDDDFSSSVLEFLWQKKYSLNEVGRRRLAYLRQGLASIFPPP